MRLAAVIIMTSNLGAAYLNDMGDGPVKPQTRELVMGAIQGHFPPEFVNRVDEIIVFVSRFCYFSNGSTNLSSQRALSRKHVLKIVDIRLKEVQDRLAERKITLDLDDGSKQYLMSVGYSPIYGARPLNRSIQSELLNPLSMMILSDRVRDGELVKVRFDGPHNRLAIIPNHEGTVLEDVDMDMDDDDMIDIEEMD